MMSPVAAANPAARALPLPLPVLRHDADIRAQAPGDLDRVVGGAPVDDDHLVEPVGEAREDVRQVLAPRSASG